MVGGLRPELTRIEGLGKVRRVAPNLGERSPGRGVRPKLENSTACLKINVM